MDLKRLTLLEGINPDSVSDHRQVQGADILDIDLAKEPWLRRAIDRRGTAGKLPDGDIFETDCTVNGVARKYEAEHMDKYRSYDFVEVGPGEPRIPGWRLRPQIFSPNALYGAAIEYISFWVFDRHSGSTTYDLSMPNDDLSRPWMSYALGYLIAPDYLRLIFAYPRSGNIEVNHVEVGEKEMDLSAAFLRIHYDVPDISDHFPEAPNREFLEVVGNVRNIVMDPDISDHFPEAPNREFLFYLPTGFYKLTGTW